VDEVGLGCHGARRSFGIFKLELVTCVLVEHWCFGSQPVTVGRSQHHPSSLGDLGGVQPIGRKTARLEQLLLVI